MPYIGQQPTNVAFLTDTFSGNGSTTAFTLSAAPASTTSVLVAISGVLQDPSTYSVSGTTLTFSPAPPSGTGNISVRFLGIPASGVTTTAYRTVTEFTATSGQTTFSVPSYTPGFIDVYRNGVMLGSADYTATSGLSVVLVDPCTVGDFVEVISFQVSSVLNAIPNSPASVGTSNIANGVTINFGDGSASTPSITNDGDTNTGMFFPAADTIAFAEGGTESMRLDSNGNVGIGTSSPAVNLDVVSALAQTRVYSTTATNSAYTQYRVGSNITYVGSDSSSGSAFGVPYASVLWNAGAYPIAFGTNSTERMRIDSSGNLLVGTTSGLGGDGQRCAIASTSTTALRTYRATTTGGNAIQIWQSDVGGTAAEKYYVLANGTATASDQRLKENITDVSDCLEKLLQVRIRNFTWVNQDGNEKDIGVIAQEIEHVLPEMVWENPNPQEGSSSYKAVRYDKLTPMLVKAIQEQQAIINDLKARIELLENK